MVGIAAVNDTLFSCHCHCPIIKISQGIHFNFVLKNELKNLFRIKKIYKLDIEKKMKSAKLSKRLQFWTFRSPTNLLSALYLNKKGTSNFMFATNLNFLLSKIHEPTDS